MTDYFVFDGGEGLGFGDSGDDTVGGEFISALDDVDHVTRGLSRLPNQYYESENLKFLEQTFLEELQELESNVQAYIQQQSLDSATGVNLDMIGEDVGYRRPVGASEESYRKKIRLKILANTSKGRYEDFSAAIKLAAETDNITTQVEYPAGFSFAVDVPLPTDDTLYLVKDTLPITVKMATSSPFSTSDRFCFAGGVGKGFTDVDAPVGSGGQFRSRKEFN